MTESDKAPVYCSSSLVFIESALGCFFGYATSKLGPVNLVVPSNKALHSDSPRLAFSSFHGGSPKARPAGELGR
ncbi:hypothetical protein [Stagnimonas aquatica]|uniref:hypothetical protein n=1 Tax=Stagnimonas aquatica TaxID=2689987 RepID=UPI0013154D79|nr:hypothetical protein [Stagnimonas aquatica]